MVVSTETLRQLLREYLEDYDINDKFSYTFDAGQILVTESINNTGINKNAVLNIFNEYLTDFTNNTKFLYDLGNCHFLVAVQTAIIKKVYDNNQKRIFKSITDDEPDSIHYCELKDKHCNHADISNNKEIGYTVCSGEYCADSKNDLFLSRCGFGENELLG